MAEEAPKVVEAKKLVVLEDIKFNEANKTMAILAWFFGIIIYFVEKEDLYVKYVAVEATLIFAVLFLVSLTGIGSCLAVPVGIVVVVMGIMKLTKGERWDLPVVSDLAIKIMNAI